MKRLVKRIVLLGICLIPGVVQAQVGFEVAGSEIQIHGYLTEGFAYSTGNNFLTMDTTRGSFFTEAGLSVSSKITDKFRVGAQAYDRYIGQLGQGKVYLDWALADYHWKDWIGFRAGKVKTPLGLYNDTQDEEFLHTWALLPQSVDPADLRSTNIAHVGGDIYGNINIKRGSLSYDAFAGSVPNDPRGGYLYGIESVGAKLTSGITGRVEGFDLRWNSPISGLMLGASSDSNRQSFNGTLGLCPLPLSYSTMVDRVTELYGEYSRGNFRADAEGSLDVRRGEIVADIPPYPVVKNPGTNSQAWFISGAYRLAKWVEVGSYYSYYHTSQINPVVPVTGPGRDHIYDRVATVRFDPARFWDFKIEGHFMNGVGGVGQPLGFYPQNNPHGFTLTTNMLVVRTGFYF